MVTQILAERDRLLAFAARCIGMASSASALACVSLPGALPGRYYPLAVVGILALGFCQFRLSTSRPLPWMAAVWAIGNGVVALVAFADRNPDPASSSTVVVIGGSAVACVAIMLVTSRARLVWLAFAYLASSAIAVLALLPDPSAGVLVAFTSASWLLCTLVGLWLSRALPAAMTKIGRLADAYETERRASETELRRRQNARLLHDTVLATLTLLAHSGVGVSADALRDQARKDADLLRQLRLGSSPSPRASGDYLLRSAEDAELGNTLESLGERFRRMGLTVTWHGSGRVLLPGTVLDDFLLALTECLENVRRHAGVGEAQVTITDDDATVRAMITDAGIGFDVTGIDRERLGYTESIVARLRDIGGTARLFSSPGSGTTVVLEVPK